MTICEIDAACLGGEFCGDNDDLQAIVDFMNANNEDSSVRYEAHTSTVNGGRTYDEETGEPAAIDDQTLFLAACQSRAAAFAIEA